MSITIGGMKQQDALKRLGITRATMSRYRQHPHWPGDDAPWTFIETFVDSVKSSRGRKPKSPAPTSTAGAAFLTPPSAGVEAEELTELHAMLGLDDELKRTIIEKNKAQIKAYQEKCLAEYRAELTKRMTDALLIVFNELSAMDLPRSQLENVRKAIHAARDRVLHDGGDYQPELI